MKKLSIKISILGLMLFWLAPCVFGAIPLQVNHQGRVTVNDFPFNGNGDFRFALVDPDTGNNVWTNDGTNIGSSTMPTAAVLMLIRRVVCYPV